MPSRVPLTDAAIASSGAVVEDEGLHPFPTGLPDWQESVFYDWVDASGAHAGHCRIGIHPEEGRVWFWLFLFDGRSWWSIEAPRLPLAEMDTDQWVFDQHGLRFARHVPAPLRCNTLEVQGTARGISGPGAGQLQPVTVNLRFDAVGPPHSMGGREEMDETGATFSASRFEQPMDVTGTVEIGEHSHLIAGWGERDHSWGSRYWAFLDWTFLVLHSDALRMQCADVRFGGAHFVLGYVLEEQMHAITDAALDLVLRPDLDAPCAGTVRVQRAEGDPIVGRVEPIGVVAIDIDHVYRPESATQPIRSVYRRALVRFQPEDGGAPVLGWLEWCRRPPWLDADA